MNENLLNNQVPTILSGNETKCHSCNNHLHEVELRYCPFCGVILEQIEESEQKLIKYLWPVFFFFIPSLAIPLFSKLEIINTYKHLIFVEIAFSTFILFFFLSDFKKLSRLYNLKKLNHLLWIIPLSIGGGFAVHTLVDFLHVKINIAKSDLLFTFFDAPNPFLYTIIFICIQPAIFEEMIFRGFVNEKIRNIMPVTTAVIISSFMFALLHFSLISLPWLFAMGIFYGWLSIRYRNLLLSSVAHFTHNLTIVVLGWNWELFGMF